MSIGSGMSIAIVWGGRAWGHRARFDSGRAGAIWPLLPFCVSSSLACRLQPSHPPSGSNWIHEIKHDGYRLMARSDSVASG